MTDERRYPEEPAGRFERPPSAFTDEAGRDIQITRYGDGPGDIAEDRAALSEMYRTFDPADRAQGIPPSGDERLDEWLDVLTREDTVNVLAWHNGRVAGHATLVPDDRDAYELAIFVHQDYQRAGIGGRLIRCLLGAGQADGIDLVWLTVERWNHPAINLYQDVGFETIESRSFELEMTIRLA